MILVYYVRIYIALILSYLWYRFILKFISDIKENKDYPPYHARCTVIIPTFNEDEKRLAQCIKSIIRADGDKEIIIVDDHSTNNTWQTIKMLQVKYPEVKVIRFDKNQGKRMAQYHGLKLATGEIIVTVDSDTLLDKHAITNLIKPFNDPTVGATTGNVRGLNKNQNFLTKMIDARYLNAFSFERKALSAFGIVTCCSGVLSAYRKDILETVKEIYIKQRFLGKKCTYGDDRHLTNLILKRRYKSVFVKSAKAVTDLPFNMSTYIVQQLRWKKSFIRESLITLSFSWKVNKLLFIETIYNITIPFFSVFARLFIIYSIILSPILLIPISLSIIFIALLRNILLLFEEGRVALYSLPYAFIHEMMIYWLYWYALFTLKDNKWGTR